MGKSTCSCLDASAFLGLLQHWHVCSDINDRRRPRDAKKTRKCALALTIVTIGPPKRHWDVHRGQLRGPFQHKKTKPEITTYTVSIAYLAFMYVWNWWVKDTCECDSGEVINVSKMTGFVAMPCSELSIDYMQQVKLYVWKLLMDFSHEKTISNWC